MYVNVHLQDVICLKADGSMTTYHLPYIREQYVSSTRALIVKGTEERSLSISTGDGNLMNVTFQGPRNLSYLNLFIFLSNDQLITFAHICFRFNGTALLEKIRGKRVVFVGDSLNRNQWRSMLCLIQSSLPLPLNRKVIFKDHLYSYRVMVSTSLFFFLTSCLGNK